MKERRKLPRYSLKKYLTVYNSVSGQPIGELVNMSEEGAMFVTPEPIRETTSIPCRVKLPLRIMEQDEIVFEAEYRWCRKNIKKNRWESGYRLVTTGINAELIPYLVLGFEIGDWGDKDLPEVTIIGLESRRGSVRYEFDFPLPVFEVDSYRQIGELSDLSTLGIGIITNRPVKKGDRLNCRVKLPRKVFQEDYLVLQSVCMWSRKIGEQSQYESGHRIETISKRDTAIILNLIIHGGEEQHAERAARVLK